MIFGSSYGLLQVKQKIKNVKSDIVEKKELIKKENDKIHSLNAEYSYLSRPNRIKKLSDKHLNLNYVKTQKVRNIADIAIDTGSIQALAPEEKITPILKPLRYY